MSEAAVWFRSLVVAEIFFQVPFFVFAAICYLYRLKIVRIPAILYRLASMPMSESLRALLCDGSAEACTSLVPILASFIVPYIKGKDIEYDVGRLMLTYAPFFLIPFLLGLRWTVYADPPFSKPQQQKRKEKDV